MFRQKKVISILCVLVMVSALFLVPSFSSSAAMVQETGQEFYVHYAQPSISDNQGYVNLLMYSSNRGYYINTIWWQLYGVTETGELTPTQGVMTLTDNKWVFGGFGNTSNIAGFMYSIYMFNADGHCWHIKSSTTEGHTHNVSGTILGYQAYGNVRIDDSGLTSGNTPFTVYYSTDGSAVLLREMLEILEADYESDNWIRETIYSILQNTDGVEEQLQACVSYLKSVDDKLGSIKTELEYIYAKCDELLEEQKESNNWLEKIFNYLNESKEKEKQEAQTQGNSSTSQGMNAIDDKGAGFTDSLGGLVSSMSYTGTECAWNFPEIKLPAISGVMDEVVLMESQPIDFSQWVGAIPSSILTVVQSLLTIGLIVYCFKELYSTIAYVLTLRKDDNA